MTPSGGRRRAALNGMVLLAGLAAPLDVARGKAETGRAGAYDFRLTDTAGQRYSLDSFASDTLLVIYFGYTTCLQACPTALDSIAAAIDGLDPPRSEVRLLFIDMDSERAAMASLPLYMESFGPSFLGLTGSPEDLARAADAFDVQVTRIRFSDEPGDYAMSHVSPIFVMRPDDPRPVSLPADSSPAAIGTALLGMLES